MLPLTFYFGEQGAQVLRKVNHMFFNQASNNGVIKVKEELKVVIMFLISFSGIATN